MCILFLNPSVVGRRQLLLCDDMMQAPIYVLRQNQLNKKNETYGNIAKNKTLMTSLKCYTKNVV